MDIAQFTYATYFPASLVIRVKNNEGKLGEPEVIHNRKVYVTDGGLLIYKEVLFPNDHDASWAERRYEINWGNTNPPGHPRNGVTIDCTEAEITITQSGACGCGNPLKNFFPTFTRKMRPWPKTA